jgi:hypothetical protein
VEFSSTNPLPSGLPFFPVADHEKGKNLPVFVLPIALLDGSGVVLCHSAPMQ